MANAGIWDRELELLRFDGWSARWAPEDGDPTQPLDVILSWHPDSERVTPRVTGTVVSVHEVRTASDRTDEVEYRRATTLSRFPAHGDALPHPAVAVVGFLPETFAEPAIADIAAEHAAAERRTRTVRLTGPATAFGPVVPPAHSRLTIDLDTPGVEPTGGGSRVTGVVSGDTGQVSRMVSPARPDGGRAAYTMLTSVPEGSPTAELDDDLFVVLTIDPEFF